MSPKSWIARSVKIADGFMIGEIGTVLAVDDTPYRPSAWVKVAEDREYPAYRSVDLCWLEDVATGETGPVWGTGGYGADEASSLQVSIAHEDVSS